jgi:hypothetical protein
MSMTDRDYSRTITTISDYTTVSPFDIGRCHARTAMKPGDGVTPKRPPPCGHSDVPSHTFGPARWIATLYVCGICGMIYPVSDCA